MTQSFLLFGVSASLLEIVSFLLSVITVWLTIRQTHWAWLFAIVSSATYGAVFVGSRLYGDAGLQLVFIVVAAWGWYQWLYGGSGHHALPVSSLSRRALWLCVFGWLAGFALLSQFLLRYTDTDVPYVDGFLTAGSLLGQFLLSRKKLENWHVWITIDVLYVGLYIHKHLMLTAVLYALFVAMAVTGLRVWRKSQNQDSLAARVALLGGESSGKTTLAAALALHYRTLWVPEYLREFTVDQGRPPLEAEQIGVARGQIRREQQALPEARDFLFCDTTPLMIAIYSDFCFGRIDAELELLAQQHTYEFTIVTAPDIPWVADGLQRASDQVRQQVHAAVLARLQAAGTPFLLVCGDLQQRLQQTITYLDRGEWGQKRVISA